VAKRSPLKSCLIALGLLLLLPVLLTVLRVVGMYAYKVKQAHAIPVVFADTPGTYHSTYYLGNLKVKETLVLSNDGKFVQHFDAKQSIPDNRGVWDHEGVAEGKADRIRVRHFMITGPLSNGKGAGTCAYWELGLSQEYDLSVKRYGNDVELIVDSDDPEFGYVYSKVR
jgi:hypothetical protein